MVTGPAPRRPTMDGALYSRRSLGGDRCLWGEFRSVARLRREGVDIPAIGFEELGEPDEYAEHIMFSRLDGIGAEHVVASHARGRVFTQDDTPYTPGVRLYVDCHAIVRRGLAVRDGVHAMKVRGRLPLEPFLVAAIGVAEVDPERSVPMWPPRSFLDAANACFGDLVARAASAP